MRLFRVLAVSTGLVMLPIAAPASAALPTAAVVSVLAPAPANAVPGQYIVMLKESEVSAASLDASAADLVARHNGTVRASLSTIRGFSAELSAAEAADLARDPDVLSVTQNAYVKADTTQPVPAPPNTYWGLDRIDQRGAEVNGKYTYGSKGTGVRVYVLDTGVRIAHRQFGGRASNGYDFVSRDGVAQDGHGHGTHVAGIIAGSTFGVAKNAKIVAVRVLNNQGSGTWEQVIQGVDWVTRKAVRPAVANMSLGGLNYGPVNAAVARSIRSGVSYTLAAGNENTNACTRSPASTPSAITVGSTGTRFGSDPVTDDRSDFSNYGSCLDVFAPGARIKSAWKSSNTSTNTISGTSMASPHVAGVAALFLSNLPTASPSTVRNYLVNNSTRGVVGVAGRGSPNRLLYVGEYSRMTFDASPEPVVKNRPLYLRGTLTRLGRALPGRSVELWFKTTTGPYVKKATVTTDATGSYSTRLLTQSRNGTWRAYFRTSGVLVGTSKTDHVKIK
jgi:subtilisin family serine protease